MESNKNIKNMCPYISICDFRKKIRDKNEYIDCYLENAKKCLTYNKLNQNQER